jgi:hypothetical protein
MAVNLGLFCRETQKTAQTVYSRKMSRIVFDPNREELAKGGFVFL